MSLMRCAGTRGAGALLSTLLIAGCGSPRSLVRVYVDGDKPMANVELSLKAMGTPAEPIVMGQYPSVTVPMTGVDQLKVGLYLPSAMHGSVVVRGTAIAGGCEIGAGEATASNVESGAVVTINLTLKSETCIPVGDAGADGMPGTGGEPGTGGAPGTGGESGTGGVPGTGGMPGTGGTPATGGAPGTGGVPGTGGTPATGGAPGTGGVDAGPPDLPMDVPPEVACVPEPIARACGLRCNTDVRNNCNQLVHCGDCTTPGDVCGGGGVANVCAPCADNRACRGVECGTVVDACGQKVTCGTCLLREVCCMGRCELPIRCPIATQ